MATDPTKAQLIIDKAIAEGKPTDFVIKLSNKLGVQPPGLEHPTNLQIKNKRDKLIEKMNSDGIAPEQQAMILTDSTPRRITL